MLKMKMILWALGCLLSRASKRNKDLQAYLGDKELAFYIQTRAGVGRQFYVKDRRVFSQSALALAPTFQVIFASPEIANKVMTSKDKNAFLKGIQDKEIVVEGDLKEVLWFQGMLKYLKPKKQIAKA
jgi:hypothetical protein